MANTESMPDEVLESLLMNTSATPSTASSVASRRRLQKRMDTPMGERPAATVVRAVPKVISKKSAKISTGSSIGALNSKTSKSPSEVPVAPSVHSSTPLVGSISERPQPLKNAFMRKGASCSKVKWNKSGFPSVSAPVGTFTRTSAHRCRSTVEPISKGLGVQKSSPSVDSGIIKSSSGRNNPSSMTALLEDSRRDAENILTGMSQEEIRDNLRDLEASLSPAMKEFLRTRGGSNKTKLPTENTERGTKISVDKPTTLSESQIIPRTNPISYHLTPAVPIDAESREKARFAKLVSSIRSYEDLDAAYAAEMQHGEDDNDERSEQERFSLACDLLRSTSPRQTLWAARVVSRQLNQYVESGSCSSVRDWPITLPVSLRCLLDHPLRVSNPYLLHTYVLQSFYSLLCLVAHTDHVLLLGQNLQQTAAMQYQHFFLDDAVPTPQLGACYPSLPAQTVAMDDSDTKTAATSDGNDPQGVPVATFSASSSSKSAQVDGEAFHRDPMWTMLSRMRILPRFAELLNSHRGLPPEGLVAICGILCMVCQRSPGAASAIAHHAIVLPRLLDQSLRQHPIYKEEAGKVDVALPAVVLLCTLARQSRVVALAIPMELDELLPSLLAHTPTNEAQTCLQQWAVILWRTFLRYGMGLSSVSAMLLLAARPLALGSTHLTDKTTSDRSFSDVWSTAAITAFAQVLECARIARRNSCAELSSDLKEEQVRILAMVSTWMSSTRRLLLSQFIPSFSTSPTFEDMSLRFRWNAARLGFLSCFWRLSIVKNEESQDNGEPTTQAVSTEEAISCLNVLHEWGSEGGDVELAWKMLARYATVTDFGTLEQETDEKRQQEAAASAFLQALVSLILALDESTLSGRRELGNVRELSKRVVRQCAMRFLEGTRQAAKERLFVPSTGPFSKGLPLAQRGWINQSHFAIAKFLVYGMSSEAISSSQHSASLRLLVFSLLGRLERGDESVATVLFSFDGLFQTSNNSLQMKTDSEYPSNTSPISSMFLRELCGSGAAQKQLDHSFKLQLGFGITSRGLGPFGLDSLLSEADQPKPKGNPPSLSSEPIMPIGKFWLWKILSGSMQLQEQSIAKCSSETAAVVSSCLRLLLELEEDPYSSGYAGQIPLGAKLYYLINTCLHTETVLRDRRVIAYAEEILERYLPRMDNSQALEFSKACIQHSSPTKKLETDVLRVAKDDMSLALHSSDVTGEKDSGDSALWSSQEIRALRAFIEDLSSAYNEYGAQYDFFTKCIRLFLLPIFPSVIRCHTLQSLRDILHLLTLPSDMEEQDPFGRSGLTILLERSISGGISRGEDGDSFSRDPSDILNMATSLLSRTGSPRPLQGYILQYSIALLVRNLTINILLQASSPSMGPAVRGLEALKGRLLSLDTSVMRFTLEATATFLKTKLRQEDLAEIMVQLSIDSYIEAEKGGNLGKFDKSDLEEFLRNLERGLEKSA